MALLAPQLAAVFVTLVVKSTTASVTGSTGEFLSRLRELRSHDPTSTQQTLLSLDTNRDGRVGFDEVASFAKSNGLDYAATLQEFSGFDTDHDGSLNAAEIAEALVSPTSAGTAMQVPRSSPTEMPKAEMSEHEILSGSSVGSLVPIASGNSLVPSEIAALTSGSSQSLSQRAARLSEVANVLALEVRKEQEAESLDRKAAELHERAMALRRKMAQQAQERSTAAAKAKAEELFQNISSIDDHASRLEIAAAAVHAKSSAQLKEATDFSSVADAGLAATSTGVKAS